MEKEVETWKDIIGFEGYYQVSNFGRVKSVDRTHERLSRTGNLQTVFLKSQIKKHCQNRDGYLYVNLSKNGKNTSIKIHRELAKAFLPVENGKTHVDHIDGNKLNNHVNNLRWCTHAENITFAWDNGLYNNKGSGHAMAKLNESQVKVIKIMQAAGVAGCIIADKFNVSQQVVCDIKMNRHWAHCVPKIGISITTHNRYDLFKKTLENIKKFLPKYAEIVIVDDASFTPVPEATYRLEINGGISVAKNKTLELMGNCDYYFCFDDDTWPIVENWHLPYILSGINHMSYTFNRAVVNKTDTYISYEVPSGCMLFFTKICLDTIGGWDINYTKYSYDHVDFSKRIFNAGLTPEPYLDVLNAHELFYSADFHGVCVSSVSGADKSRHIRKNHAYFMANKDSREFKAYK